MDLTNVHIPILPRNQFKLEEVPIGRGGYGTVFRGEHPTLGLVAVKTLIDTGLLPQKHLTTLQREAEKLRGVCQHPSILNLHGIITEKDNYSLVLEYMPLGSANEFRKDYTVQWPLIVQIVRDVIDGMAFLHGHDPTILHLDLKADNILLDKGIRAKISDFGLSEWKTITMTVTRGGQSSSRRCTVTHVPPEVWSNVNLPSDKYYDIYSFGIIIWELLSGQSPYKNASEELIRSSVLSGQRPDFIQIPKDCPMFLTKMMTRCWHQKTTQRPAFQVLKPEIEKEFNSNYRKDIVKSLKKVRQEITRMYPASDPIYYSTNEIDSMVEPVEQRVPSTSTSELETTTTPKVIDETQPSIEIEPTQEEKEIPKVLYKLFEELTPEEKDVRRVLFSPTACRLAKTRHVQEIFKISDETRQILIDPVKRKKYIEADETLARQLKYCRHNALYELDGEFFEYQNSLGRQYTESESGYRQIYDKQRCSYYKNGQAYGSGRDEEPTDRGKKHSNARKALEENPTIQKLKHGGEFYKVKKLLENPEVLKQALDDKRKGVDNSLRLVAVESETLELVKNPFLLIMVFNGEYELSRKYKEKHRDLYMELLGNARHKYDLPTGGYKLPNDLEDLIPYWLESEMKKEGFDVNRMVQQQDMGRRRSHYSYGMYPDMDDEMDEYRSMRYMSHRMSDVSVRPGSKIHERMDGYQIRRMLEDVGRKDDGKSDLAKKLMRILYRPPREEIEEMKRKEKERRAAGLSSSAMDRDRDPIEIMMMMSGDTRLDERALRQIMKIEQRRMREMRRIEKKATSTVSPSASLGKSIVDLETDASGSMPESSAKSTSQGHSNPTGPKKSKSDEIDGKDSAKESPTKRTKDKDVSLEIEHKSSGAFGAITKLFFGKSAKVPNMQVGDKNVMHVGQHFEDSDDDDYDYMLHGTYDKAYKPPFHARPPTKEEMDRISSRIHGDYRNLGKQLKMHDNIVEQIVQDYQKEGNHELTYQLIRKWMAMNGEAATNVVLSDALHKMRRDDLSKYLRF